MNINEMLLSPNSYSRPRTKLKKVKGIVIHWVANAGSTALANRIFFENRKNGKSGYGSAHYIVGLKGEIIQCIPNDEVAYHVGSETYTNHALTRLSSYPNNVTIGIEMCHPDATGKPTLETLDATLELTAHLLKAYNLTNNDLWLHKEVVGWKNCHKYYVENPIEWKNFKSYVNDKMNKREVEKVSNWKDQMGITWKDQMGISAVNELAKKNLIADAEYWHGKMKEPAENWLFFEMIKRLSNEIDKIKG